MIYRIAVAGGDGVGPEVTASALRILDKIGEVYGHTFRTNEILVGGIAYDKYQNPLPEESIRSALESDAVLFGSVGGSKWDNLPGKMRPEQAILGLRKAMNLYTNIRPGFLFSSLKDVSPLKNEIVGEGFDICVVRELVGGIYFGEKGTRQGSFGEEAFDVEVYGVKEVERIAKSAFELAGNRSRKVTSVDKANVLESSRLWRRVVESVWVDYPDIELEHMYVDNAAMQVIRDPRQFDVILTSNIFGDILSDEISMITGSIGLLPSSSTGEGTRGIYEPIHGSAPDIAGKGIVNPIGSILSAAMMLEQSFGLENEAKSVRNAVEGVLKSGYQTVDIRRTGGTIIGTSEITELILKYIEIGTN